MSVEVPASVGRSRLTPGEQEQFNLMFKRFLVLHNLEKPFIDIFIAHQTEFIIGAEIAKNQFNDKPFGGVEPSSNQFGAVITRAGFWGIGDDWTDQRPQEGGKAIYLIDSSLPNLGGSSGNPVEIGGNIVSVVPAVGTLAKNPLVEAIKFDIDKKPGTAIPTWFHFTVSQLKIVELFKTKIFYKGKQLLFSTFSRTSGPDALYFLGISYLPWEQLEKIDVAQLSGDRPSVILTT